MLKSKPRPVTATVTTPVRPLGSESIGLDKVSSLVRATENPGPLCCTPFSKEAKLEDR